MTKHLFYLRRVGVALSLGALFLSGPLSAAGISSNSSSISLDSEQNQQVSGKVLTIGSEPLIGATVIIKGTTIGVITGMDGDFNISAPKDATLEVSYLGYITQNVAVGGKTELIITLQDDALKVDDVVIVGYGSQVKANLTGSVAQVTADELKNRPSTTISQSLQGLAPGVTVTSSQGRPGGDSGSIKIRGVGSLNNSNPYILIDGIEAASLDIVDPNDVASISILKDAASAAIYGSKAANGVILVTTKRGKVGKPVVSYSGNYGWSTPTALVDRLDSWEYASMYNNALEIEGKPKRFTDNDIELFRSGAEPFTHPNTDWYDLGYQGNGFQHTHNFSISGGSENVRYMTALGFLGQNGILLNSGRDQFNARTNLDIEISKKLTARVGLAYINNYTYDPIDSVVSGVATSSDQIIRQLNDISPWIPNKLANGDYGTIADGNPIAWLDSGQKVERRTNNFTGNATLEYKIIEELKISATGAYVMNDQSLTAFKKDIQYNIDKYHGPNELRKDETNWNRGSIDIVANYNKTFGQKHKLGAMLGYHSELYKYSYLQLSRTNFPNNELTDINAGAASSQKNEGYTRELALESFFGRVNYDYDGRFLAEVNVRADASSRFHEDYRWGVFPSFSAGWRISEEKFMESTNDWLNNLKFRGSWGKLGNQYTTANNKEDYYPYISTYSIGKNYPFGGVLNQGVAQEVSKIRDITWENSRNWGVGIDATFFNSLSITVDYYDRKTTDILMQVNVPATFGLGSYTDNVGAMSNKGIEFSAAYNKVFGDWTVGANGHFAYNKNELLNLGYDNNGAALNNLAADRWRIDQVGYSYNSFYVYESIGIFRSQDEIDSYLADNEYKLSGNTVRPGDLIYKDQNGDHVINGDDRIIAGQNDPSWTFGLTLSAAWKGIDVSIFFQGAAGVSKYYDRVYGEFMGDSGHPSTFWRDAWTPENSDSNVPRYALNKTSPSDPASIYSDYWLSNTNYLRMKNLQIGYTIPERFIKASGISALRIYYSGQNLFTFDNIDINVDPESPSGRGSHYPQVKINSIGLNVTF